MTLLPASLFIEGEHPSTTPGDVAIIFGTERDSSGSLCSSSALLFTVVPTRFEIQVTAWIPDDHIDHPFESDRVFHADAPLGVGIFDPDRTSFRMRQSVTVIPTQLLDSSPTQNGEVVGTNSASWPLHQRLVGLTRLYEASTSLTAPPPPQFLTQAARDDNQIGAPMMIAEAQAIPGHNDITVTRLDAVTLKIDMKMNASDPLVAVAPAIDWELTISLQTVNPLIPWYSVSGERDGYPAHDVYINGVLVDSHDPRVTGDDITALLPPMELDISKFGPLP